jgi:hypothetical protein
MGRFSDNNAEIGSIRLGHFNGTTSSLELSDKHLLTRKKPGESLAIRIVDSMSVTLRKQPVLPSQDRLYIQRGRSVKAVLTKTTPGTSSEPSKLAAFRP